VLFTALLLMCMTIMTTATSAQTTVSIEVEVLKDFVTVNVSEEDNRTVDLSGYVRIDKPEVGFVVVDVVLSYEVIGDADNFTISIEPENMRFTEDGAKDFSLTVVVPAGLENRTQLEVQVEGEATSPGLPTVYDIDTTAIVFEYPVEEEPDEPVDPVPPDIGPHPLVFCGISIVVGLLVSGLVYWVKNRRRGRGRPRPKGGTEVVYMPRSPKPGPKPRPMNEEE
jgi:hypothetical protein